MPPLTSPVRAAHGATDGDRAGTHKGLKPAYTYLFTDLQVGRPENSIFLWPAFVTGLLMTPRSRKFGYGLLLGCRSGLDGGHEKKTFFNAFPPQKP
jgi:hypothetical protein